MSKEGFVSIHGKEYKTVAARVCDFNKLKSQTTRINTELVYHDNERVIIKALIYDSDVIIATGYAEEIRSQSNINKTSAMENCETSAIGRAIRLLEESLDPYASADEVQRAISQQEEMEEKPGKPAPQKEEPQEEWTSPPQDEELLDKVRVNYKEIKHSFDDGVLWHQRTLGNLLDTKVETQEEVAAAVKGLNEEKLNMLLGYQQTKLKSRGE